MQEPFNNDNQNEQEITEVNEIANKVVEEQVEEEETSTIFSAPSEHKNEKKNKKLGFLKITAGVLAVALLVGAVFGVKKWLPEKTKDEMHSPLIESGVILQVSADAIDEVLINNASGELKIIRKEYSTGIQAEEQTVRETLLEGYDPELIDKTSLEQIITSLSSLQAYAVYDAESLEQYGLDKPSVTVKITAGEEEVTVCFGANTVDTSRCYANLSGNPSKVYVVSANSRDALSLTAFDLAISTGIQPVEMNDTNAKYFGADGTLARFDSIVLSGKKFASPITIAPNTDEAFSSYAAFITTTPQKRIANNAEELRDLFANVTSASGCVSFDQSAESLKKFGLDNPDIIVTLNLGAEKYVYKITAMPGTTNSYYVAASNDKLIRTVPITNLPFATKEEKDFYTLFMVLEAFADVESFEMTGAVNAKFDISYDEDNEEYGVVVGGKKINAEEFQNAYADFISTMGIDISVVSSSSDTTLTIKLHHKDGSPATVLSFKKVSETRYQYYVGGTAMGQITSTAYNTIVRNFSGFLTSE